VVLQNVTWNYDVLSAVDVRNALSQAELAQRGEIRTGYSATALFLQLEQSLLIGEKQEHLVSTLSVFDLPNSEALRGDTALEGGMTAEGSVSSLEIGCLFERLGCRAPEHPVKFSL